MMQTSQSSKQRTFSRSIGAHHGPPFSVGDGQIYVMQYKPTTPVATESNSLNACPFGSHATASPDLRNSHNR